MIIRAYDNSYINPEKKEKDVFAINVLKTLFPVSYTHLQSGVPEEEIAFIHDVDTEAKKKDLFAKVRTGQVRVLLGRCV